MLPRRVAFFCSLRDVRRHVSDVFAPCGWEVDDYGDGRPLNCAWADAAILECSGNQCDAGLALARQIRQQNANARIVFIAKAGSEDLAIEALRIGAVDYLKPPVDLIRLARAVGSEEIGCDLPVPQLSDTTGAIVGESPAILQIKKFILKVAASDSSVLVTGETGTGKEMIAEHIHRLGRRSHKRFVCVNCSAIPESLVESELFGHEKGAFTGAVSARDGRLMEAHAGTLFFDEIGDMTPLAQAKILRAIESKEFYRVGGTRPIKVDVRLIAATNRDLEGLMREERFRADLFFRLNVARIELPSLRDRPSDIPLLLAHFLRHYNRVFNAAVERFAGGALDALLGYPWPGNVRELKNVVEAVFLNLAHGETVVRDLPRQILCAWRKLNELPPDERESMVRALLATHWNVSAAARKLEWSRMTMYRKLAKYNIKPEREPVGKYNSKDA
jgi:DNA-binding NtrC family response regulator